VRLTVLVLEDEPEVREALVRDLEPFAATVRIEAAQDVPDAWSVIDEVDREGDRLALVLADHRLPGTSGVDLLVALLDDARTAGARKVLVTGQADQQDTIRAVNEAGLDHYIAKPWDADELREVVRDQLTEHVLEHRLDPLPHLPALDTARALTLVRDLGDR
jgi:two-component system, OmpR family, phosphate regulon response regulator PhoB